jgi:DNA primase
MLHNRNEKQILHSESRKEKVISEGEKLAKVLWYYNLVPSIQSGTDKIVCPFHADVNPSLIVNYKDGSWYCFGCSLSGNAQRFVTLMEQKYNGLNDLQALVKYHHILKSKKCSSIKLKINYKQQKSIKIDLYNEAHDYYYGLRTIDWRYSDEQEIIEAKAYMNNRGFTTSVLNKCKAKVTYNKSYGLIFPMLDNGEFKGWVCRTMLAEIEKKRKYLYNEGFSRATTLVGDYGTKKYVFVVEGYMDRLKFIQFGESNVVAILGWKMTAQQIQKLKDKGITIVISALDNDDCGKRGTKYLREFFEVIRFKYLKGIKDPGEMTQELFDKMYNKTIKMLKEK